MKILYILILAFLLFSTEPVRSQTQKIDSLRNEIPNVQGIELAKLDIEIASALYYHDPVEAIEFCENAVIIARNESYPYQEIEALIIKSGAMLICGQTQKGFMIADSVSQLPFCLDEPMLHCKALNVKAMFYSYTANYDKSLTVYQEAYSIAKENEFAESAAKILVNMGTIYTQKGNYIKGIKAYEEALTFYKKQNDKHVMALLNSNIGTNYSYWLPPARAREYYTQAVFLYGEAEEPVAKAITLNNIGDTYADENNYTKAIEYYENAIEELGNSTNSTVAAVPQIGMGEAYWKLNDLEKAKQYSNRALSSFMSVQHSEGIARSKAVLGGIKLKEGDYVGANRLLSEALEIADTYEIKDLQAELYGEFADLKSVEKDYKAALEYTKTHFAIRDSLLNKYKGHQLNELLAKMEVEQKEAEIKILQKDSALKSLDLKRKSFLIFALVFVTIVLLILTIVILYFQRQKKRTLKLVKIQNQQISQQNDKLTMASEMQNKILSIIGHDLVTPVGGLKELLNMVNDNPDTFESEDLLELVPSLKGAVDDTYFLLTNLLSWAKNQGGNYNVWIESCNVLEIVNQNLSFLQNSIAKKSIQIQTQIAADLVIQFDRNMFGMVVRNLISNAVKFTPGNGNIYIYTEERDGKLIFCVKDTGIGISKENQKKLFGKEHVSTFGTDNEKGTGLGLHLCKEFVEKNNSELMVESKENEGSLFAFFISEKML
nr:tetratricopeptide repeat protein [uncultured Draconibacterium sp.]